MLGAKTKPNEILWVFLGIHTANALGIGRRMIKTQTQEAPKVYKNKQSFYGKVRLVDN